METWFGGWARLADTAVSALAIYVAVVVLLRLFGKRATSKMNNFDWVATVAVGAIASSGVILEDVAVSDAVAAITALLAAQWVLHQGIQRSERICQIFKAEPVLLLHRGRLLEGAMRRERVSEPEVLSALRDAGIARLEDAQWVVLEADATLSVVPARRAPPSLEQADALENVDAGSLREP